MLSVCAPEAFIYPLRGPHGWLCSKEWDTGFKCCFSVSACSSCSAWKLTHRWQAQVVTPSPDLFLTGKTWWGCCSWRRCAIMCFWHCMKVAHAGLHRSVCSCRKVCLALIVAVNLDELVVVHILHCLVRISYQFLFIFQGRGKKHLWK